MLNRRDFLKVAVGVPAVLSLPIDAISKGVDLIQPPAIPCILSDNDRLNAAGQAITKYLRTHIPTRRISRFISKAQFNYKYDKHISVSIQLNAREMALPPKQFNIEIAEPAAHALLNMIKTYNWRYDSIVLPNVEDRICGVFIDKGVSVRAMYGYDLTTQSTYISFDTMLVRV